MAKRLGILCLLLLCQCATKHQPIAFSPYFPTSPNEVLTTDQLLEMQRLEAEPELSLLKKKRLWDLYQIELRHLKNSSPRRQEVMLSSERLRTELDPYFAKLAEGEVRAEPEAGQNEKTPIQDKELRAEYQRAYQLWNRDENDAAWNRIEAVISNSKLAARASGEEWSRVLNLAFRIAFDTSDRARTQTAYEDLRKFRECSEESAQAGFLWSVILFGDGKPEEARRTLAGQCDKDNSGSNQLKRAYWLYRFGDETQLTRISQLSIPGYYAYLAAAYQGKHFQLPERVERFSLDSAVDMDSDSERLVKGAEECLSENLKSDATLLLRRATRRLIKDPQGNLAALLYISRLFQAAGNHLDAMKILSTVFSDEGALASENTKFAVDEFMRLFHRPFEDKIEWLGKLWSIDPDFVFSIMRQESAFNPGAVSIAGARGLMQLMPSLAKYLVDQWKGLRVNSPGYLMRGNENLSIAIFHLHQLQQLAPHPALMAASYNAGINRVNAWWKRNGKLPLDAFVELIPINETRNYVKLVLRNYLYYRGLRQGGTVEPGAIALTLPPYSDRAVSGK